MGTKNKIITSIVTVALLGAACSAESDLVGVTDQDVEESAQSPRTTAGSFGELESGTATMDSARLETAPLEGVPFAGEPFEEAPFEGNEFADYGVNGFVSTLEDRHSTFALDVDTGAYSLGRRWVDEGALPPPESVRVEEYVNALDYGYGRPPEGLALSVDGGPSPFDEANSLVRIGVQAEAVDSDERGRAALTFLVDTSGSMDRGDRLGLVKEALVELVWSLDTEDSVAIVTYDDASRVILEPTALRDRQLVLEAIDALAPGGSTNLEGGLRTAYGLARESYDPEGINRVILASDGVANVGVVDPDDLAAMIRSDADEGIQLVTVGFGMGNYNDVVMEQLADQGDGFYAYVDTLDEAERLFSDELTATLVTVAYDAKIQVEFDPELVAEYRLLGFENRAVADDDFRNQDIDAGELGAGHQVTALYEVRPARSDVVPQRDVLGSVSLRWEDGGGLVTEIDESILASDVASVWSSASEGFRLATVVAAFAEVLRDSPYSGAVDFADVAVEASQLARSLDTRAAADLDAFIAAAHDLI